MKWTGLNLVIKGRLFKNGLYRIVVEGLSNSLWVLVRLFVVLVPIMIVLEMLRESGWLQRISNKISSISGLFSVSRKASFPIAVGGIFGMTNACGVLIEHKRSGTLNKKESEQVAEMVGINHGWIDDPMIFVAIGASLPITVFAKIAIAIVWGKLASLWRRRE